MPRGAGGRARAPVALSAATVTRVNGPVVEVSAGHRLAMLDLVHVGPQRLPGEVIALEGESATVQVYEYTGGLNAWRRRARDGRAAVGRARPGSARRSLRRQCCARFAAPARGSNPAARRGTLADDRDVGLHAPRESRASSSTAGTVLGTVQETRGDRAPCARSRPEPTASLNGSRRRGVPGGGCRSLGSAGAELALSQRWPVRRPRPARARLPGSEPLVTGQRVLDLLFPDRPRQHRRDPRRLRHRQDRAAAADRQVVRRRRDRVRRLR